MASSIRTFAAKVNRTLPKFFYNIYKISSAAVFVWPVVCYILLYNKPESGTQRPVGIAGKAKMAEKR